MNMFIPHWSGNDLHRIITRIVSPATYDYFVHATSSTGKKCRVPTKQSIGCKRFPEFLCSIKHDFYYSLHVSVGWNQSGNFNSKPSGDG